MKKITLLIISVLVTLLTYSQDFNRVLKSSKSTWDGTQWNRGTINYPTDLFVIFKNSEVNIGIYKFRTYDEPEKSTYDDHITYTWKCVSGDGEKCYFMVKKFSPEVSNHMLYSIVYPSGVMYEYETE